MLANFPDLLSRIEARARDLLATGPCCHDWDHTARVRRLARELLRSEGGDLQVIELATVLHDIGRPQETRDQGTTCHAQLGAALADQILIEEGITDANLRRQITECVRTHRFRNRQGDAPASLEAKIVYDADKLDSLGAIGLARSFHFAGRVGARVHNLPDEALNSPSYSKEDTAWREFLVKQSHLAERLQTATGRRLATARLQYMWEFFDRLNQECGYPAFERGDALAKEHGDARAQPRAERNMEMRGLSPAQNKKNPPF